MSAQIGKVLSLILVERFGPVIDKVASYLFQYGTSSLFSIKKYTELPLSKIKESLTILIKFNLVTFSPCKNGNLSNYTLNSDKVMLMLRYPKYINMIKKRFDDESEIMVEELLQRGYWTASELLLKVQNRLTKNNQTISFNELKDKFVCLVTAKYFTKLPDYENEEKPASEVRTDDNESAVLSQIQVNELVTAQTTKVKNFSDKSIYWTVNFDRLHQDMRDKVIVNAFVKKFDENVGKLVEFMLHQMYIRTEPWADVSNPIPILAIKDTVKRQKHLNQLNVFFDQYMTVIEQDSSNLIRKSGEASGGSFQIYLKEAFTQFAWEVIEQYIMEKFDSKAARIFRLVKLKKYIESDMIQQLAMIPAKEAKRLSYQLLEENFLQILELRKSAVGGGPTKSFMLFHIQMERVVRMVLDLCYKSLYNIMTRRNHEKCINKRIIDKKHRVDTITMGMRAQGAAEDQLVDIEEMITPPEKEILQKIDRTMKKLNAVELEIDDTIFLLQMFLIYE